ncbi:MAG: hypothetical protein KAT00_13690 [Planctomycetes bacterium]|nr:hypothetical protein [Planctomycetota bacterium]
MDDSFVQERIAKTKLLIVAYEDAITFLIANPTQAYKLDTGQSVQDVKRADLAALNNTLGSLMNRCATLQARLNGAATVVQPYF